MNRRVPSSNPSLTKPSKSWKKLRIFGGLAGVFVAMAAYLAVNFRFTPSLATREGRCNGAPCAIQAFRGPDGRIFIKADRYVFDIDLPGRDAEEALPSALVPVGMGALYRRGEFANAPEARLKYIPTPVRIEGRTITLESRFRGTVSFTLDGTDAARYFANR